MNPRQIELCRLLVDGPTSTKELAAAMGVSESYTQTLLTATSREAGVVGRTELAVWWLRREATAIRKAGRYRRLVLVPSGHSSSCGCSVCYVRAEDRRLAAELARSIRENKRRAIAPGAVPPSIVPRGT